MIASNASHSTIAKIATPATNAPGNGITCCIRLVSRRPKSSHSSFRTEQAGSSLPSSLPANWPACAERNLSASDTRDRLGGLPLRLQLRAHRNLRLEQLGHWASRLRRLHRCVKLRLVRARNLRHKI